LKIIVDTSYKAEKAPVKDVNAPAVVNCRGKEPAAVNYRRFHRQLTADVC